ncbi:vacuole morphology and inheritance protein 14 [Sporothrix schenckii 1099-18]|uniref:Vacuole morphology and inheritance protein 14 n=1 Tax=Sporothrix schenckii 1099-18 TaxID=1397361 RepID=A0A0F2LQQ4_SPOSC|nr:vacuole morphology and inheritance protein 14 [Sporothrix schenckii 1099-18]KJR79888.1 vacuole morphology and inheritance protein 14 [Sporothrix schenckii 1099-18]
MDPSIQRALNEKLYEKRKIGALELERSIRELVAHKDTATVEAILDQLCNEYAYTVHQHSRNGGLIGLAAAAIALGSELPRYLETIVPPVLACFVDQDARVRYYACEAMYNIAKVAKGEILIYFNHIFDALCKLGADSELSVKNGAELLDRLVKDIVSESAATYVSVLVTSDFESGDKGFDQDDVDLPTAFSLKRFIPLLRDRIFVLNPFTRTFLVGWIVLLDSIPDLELVAYLPDFLSGLLTFLSDANRDVHIATQTCLDKFLGEIRRISRVKRGIADSRKSKTRGDNKHKFVQTETPGSVLAHVEDPAKGFHNSPDSSTIATNAPASVLWNGSVGSKGNDGSGADGDDADDGEEAEDDDYHNNDADEPDVDSEDDWVPGQDVHIHYGAILEILTDTLDSPQGEDGLLESLRWIVEFLDICPEEVLPFTPKILAHLLPALASGIETIRQAAVRVNNSLIDYVVSLPADQEAGLSSTLPLRAANVTPAQAVDRPDTSSNRASLSISRDFDGTNPASSSLLPTRAASATTTAAFNARRSPTPATDQKILTGPSPQPELDYAAAVNSLTLLFLNDYEATRVAALTWLIMLHRKAPRKVLAFNDGTFPALLKTLSDPAEAVVTKDLQLLSQISRNSEDDYFSNFMVNLLQLFSTDRKLLETRGNLIIRQLCVSLSPERIYRTLANCIEREEDVEFASIMVQNLNNNLLTAPELADLRKRLRNLETKDGQTFFVALFRSWCYNAVATFSLCLLAQAYEQAYNLLQILYEPP